MRCAALAAALLALAALAGCDDTSELAKICEEMIKERLVAPSGYRRVKVVELDAETTGKTGVGILYDAPNGYGAPIRGGGICEYEFKPGERVDAWKVRLDGKTRNEWLLEIVRGDPENRPAKPE